ncbi:MAG: hypothetical protein E6G55_01225 [Actinobacteria bacterium]|nr:MAG: hypothetical protein E6G55_01225 [Actinomycetota bacterium]
MSYEYEKPTKEEARSSENRIKKYLLRKDEEHLLADLFNLRKYMEKLENELESIERAKWDD